VFLSGFVFSHWSSGFHTCLVVLLLGKCCARYAIVWLLHNLCCIGPFFYSFALFAFLSCVFKSHVIITIRLFLYNAVITVLWNECLPFATNLLEKMLLCRPVLDGWNRLIWPLILDEIYWMTTIKQQNDLGRLVSVFLISSNWAVFLKISNILQLATLIPIFLQKNINVMG